LRDFMRGTDLTRIPDDVVAMYDNAPIKEGVLVFTPEQTETTV
jgi:hypothetical protein